MTNGEAQARPAIPSLEQVAVVTLHCGSETRDRGGKSLACFRIIGAVWRSSEGDFVTERRIAGPTLRGVLPYVDAFLDIAAFQRDVRNECPAHGWRVAKMAEVRAAAAKPTTPRRVFCRRGGSAR